MRNVEKYVLMFRFWVASFLEDSFIFLIYINSQFQVRFSFTRPCEKMISIMFSLLILLSLFCFGFVVKNMHIVETFKKLLPFLKSIFFCFFMLINGKLKYFQVVLVSELYANLMQKRARNMSREAFIVENLYVSKHIIPFIPTDIRCIRYIDQTADAATISTSSSAIDMQSCRFCHSRYSLNRAFK